FGTVTLELLKPARLCAPANKRGEDMTAPEHPGHLLCYKTKNLAFGTVQTFTNSQFGPAQPLLIHRRELCVPSLKNPSATTTTTSTTPTTTSSTTTTTTTTTSTSTTTTTTMCVPATTCPAGQTCGTASDGCGGSLNCGSCGECQTCGSGNTCVPAADNTSCPAGLCCGGTCTDTNSDLSNCGACGNDCSNTIGNDCVNGTCCQSEDGETASCSASVPCCTRGDTCRTGDPNAGTCCAPAGTVTCYTNDQTFCCNGCAAFDPTCSGACPCACQ